MIHCRAPTALQRDVLWFWQLQQPFEPKCVYYAGSASLAGVVMAFAPTAALAALNEDMKQAFKKEGVPTCSS